MGRGKLKGEKVKAPKRPQLCGLDDSGAWVAGGYGLSDRPGGGWLWSATPQYRLDMTTNIWRTV